MLRKGTKRLMNRNVSEIFGSMVFNDDVMRERLPKEVYKSLIKTIATGRTIDPSIADVVARRPPEGKEEASDSPLMSSLPENSITTLQVPTGEMKASCFSAVTPVSG